MLSSSVYLSTDLSRRHEIAWRLFGHSCTIAWFDGHTYNRSTTSTSCVDIFRSPRRPSCFAPLDAALPPRFWPRTSQTAAGADEPTPAGFVPADTSASLLLPAIQRRHDFLLLRASYYFRFVERNITAVISVISVMSDDLPERF